MTSHSPGFWLVLLLLLLTAGAFGQAAVGPTAVAEPAPAGGIPGPPASEAGPDPEVLRAFERLAQAHPRELSAILRLDPSLLANAEYVAKYPELAALVAEYPQLQRNPRLYVSRASLPHIQADSAAETIAEGMAIFATVSVFVLAGMWLIRTIVEQRRWTRLAKVQTDAHTKLLDRFTASEDLLRYIQSPAGTRFLESAPIQVRADRGTLSPAASTLWSLQVGIVIAAASVGLLLVSGSFEEAAPQVHSMGIIGLCIGIGFAVSGLAATIASKKLVLFESHTVRPDGE